LLEQAESQRRSYESRFIGRDLEVIWDRRFPNRLRGLSENYITVYAPDQGQALGSRATVRAVSPTDDGVLAAGLDSDRAH
jgi:hypothetical protein